MTLSTHILLIVLVENMAPTTAMSSGNRELCGIVFERHDDFALFDNVVNSFQAASEMDCGISCMKNDRCQSYNFQTGSSLGRGQCDLNNQTRRSKPRDWKERKGFTYFGSVPVACVPKTKIDDGNFQCHPGFKGPRCLTQRFGFFQSKPGHSCKHIRDTGDSKGDGEYWIDPENNGVPLKVFCDMTTDRGGWLLVANFVMDSSTPPPDWSAETAYRGISNYHNNRMGITKSAMNQLRTHLSFTQMRFHCSKQLGNTFHVTTVANNTGEAVVQYFSGQTNVLPSSCHSFVKMSDDNSRLAAQCDKWGNDGGHRAGKWAHYRKKGERRMYDHTAFVAFKNHWVIVEGTWQCDDKTATNLLPGDFWKIYVR